jgi:type I restriction enzyme S subunit
VNHGTFAPSENKALPSEFEPQTRYTLKKGDLLISRANTRKLVGSAAVVQQDYPMLLLCDKLYRTTFPAGISPDFVMLFLSSDVVREQIELGATGASQSMQNIGQDTIKELSIALPSSGEMKAILSWLKEFLGKISSTIQKSVDAIELLQERRTALISATVTGKIDVRDWKPPAQEEPEREGVAV